MPGFLTHYAFGNERLNKLTESYVKRAIKENIEVYNLGLQGPDIFFYFIAYPLIYKKNIGSLIHKENIAMFFETLIEMIIFSEKKNEKKIITSYMAGFLGHYILDKNCHPYIYYKSGYRDVNKLPNLKNHESHICLESDIDNIVATKIFKLKISNINYRELVKLNDNQLNVVSKILDNVCNTCYDNIRFNKFTAKIVLKNFTFLIGFFNDTKGIKFKILNKVEKKIFKCGYISPLINGDFYKCHFKDALNLERKIWINPWDTKKKRQYLSYKDLWNRAASEFDRYVEVLNESITSKNKEIFNEYIEEYSYITGLELKKNK